MIVLEKDLVRAGPLKHMGHGYRAKARPPARGELSADEIMANERRALEVAPDFEEAIKNTRMQ